MNVDLILAIKLCELFTARNVLTPVPAHETSEGQIFVYVRPMHALIIQFYMLKLLRRSLLKPPVARDGKRKRDFVRKGYEEMVIRKCHLATAIFVQYAWHITVPLLDANIIPNPYL